MRLRSSGGLRTGRSREARRRLAKKTETPSPYSMATYAYLYSRTHMQILQLHLCNLYVNLCSSVSICMINF